MRGSTGNIDLVATLRFDFDLLALVSGQKFIFNFIGYRARALDGLWVLARG